jgi:hypothetical protein
MSREEAELLYSYVLLDCTPAAAQLRQIGNGEWVVIMKRWGWHCWHAGDYHRFCQLVEVRDPLARQLVAVGG